MHIDDNPGFNRLWHVYNEALKSKCFIYNKNKKEWMTPEAFREKYDNDELTHNFITRLLDDLVIRDPIAGINAAHKQMINKIDHFKTEIDKEMLRISEFSKTTIQYYQEKKKK